MKFRVNTNKDKQPALPDDKKIKELLNAPIPKYSNDIMRIVFEIDQQMGHLKNLHRSLTKDIKKVYPSYDSGDD